MCSTPSGEPALWPVDAALRPEGKDGPLVRTIAADAGSDVKTLIGNSPLLKGIRPDKFVTDEVGLPTAKVKERLGAIKSEKAISLIAIYAHSIPNEFPKAVLEEAEKADEEVSLKTEYKKGDKIKVTNGAFQNFEGEVDEVIPDKGMVRIITTIFGRPTPLELEYWQIEKM